MAGVYIHIPFCRKKCHYCDFFRSINIGKKHEIIDCIIKEVELKSEYLGYESIKTIYFGGGTPSVLSIEEINRIIGSIKTLGIETDPEITFEANPDDLTEIYLQELKNNTAINRLSIGIQSFDDDDLIRMNRRHDAKSAIYAIENSLKIGFENISIDLIYGLPDMTVEKWKRNLEMAFSFDIRHLSAYHLTYEADTIFYEKLQRGEFLKMEEEQSIGQFNILSEMAEKNNFEHYEVSNFASKGFYSLHNSNYWLQKKYLGLGPSAHSYNLDSRQWNISNINEYIKRIKKSETFYTIELLDTKTKFNEYVMTRLRTMWGLDLKEIEKLFGSEYFNYLINSANPFLSSMDILKHNDKLILSRKGVLISDYILTKLLLDAEEGR